ncbi:MAG: hypothetical protein IKN31_00790 [Bacteroidales bacterium]|nr:hypothetical protein [Bacteroidales bacterium]
MRNYLCSLILVLLVTIPATAGNPPRAKWIGSPPSGNQTMYFVVVHTDASSTLDGARAYSLKELASNVERTDKVSINEVYSDKSKQKYDSDGHVDYSGYDEYSIELLVEGSAAPIHSRRVDEYWKTVSISGKQNLDYYALYAVERVGTRSDFSVIEVSNNYGIQSMWRSCIVPGWGQMYKGSYTKGGFMMGGTLVAAVGMVYAETQRRDYVKYMSQTHDANIIRFYQAKANQFATVRNICIGSTAAVYIWNLVDALAAPGASYIIIRNNRISMSPITYYNGGVGISATYSF